MKPVKQHSLLLLSLGASFALHVLVIYLLFTYPMLLRYSIGSLFGISTPAPDYLECQEELLTKKNRTVEEVFKQIFVLSPHRQQPFDLVSLPRGMAIAPSSEPVASLTISQEEASGLPHPREEGQVLPLLVIEREEIFPSLDLIESPIRPALLLEISIAASLETYELEQGAFPQEAPYIVDALCAAESHSAPVLEPQSSPQDLQQTLLARSFPLVSALPKETKGRFEFGSYLGIQKISESPALSLNEITPEKQPLNLHVSFTEEDLGSYLPALIATTAEWNEDFELDIAFMQNPEGKGYIFSLSLKPNFDLSQYSLKQDLIFIIDRSVRKHQFNMYKRAVVKALASLQQGDTFNIYIIDKKLTRFNAQSVPMCARAVRAAEEFLERQQENALFTQGDIYSCLDKILPEITATDSVHSAIVLSDGMTQLSTRKQQRVFNEWIAKNQGQVALYTAAVGDQNDLVLLDFLSRISGGKLLWSDTHASFPRKLAKLILDLRDPIATDLTIETFTSDPHARIELVHSRFQAPFLFSHQPYVILGTIENPGAFDLVIQGRHNDQWIAIKKNVSFLEGVKADRRLLTAWTAEQVEYSYAKFLLDGKGTHLKDAKDFVKTRHSEVVSR